jgi:hypothetical protein
MTEETATGITMRLIRNEIIEECAAVAQRWADDAAEFKSNPKCELQHNVCRNLAQAIRNLAKRYPQDTNP